MSNQMPIGFFDSGVGGLSVMKEVRLLLPAEDFLYFADSAYCPYGTKPLEVIRSRALALCDFLKLRGAKIIVIASNTTSITALDNVRSLAGIPVVGIEPAVKPAVQATRNGKIGVLATVVTLSGDRFNSLVDRYGDGVQVYTQPCPGLVELVEAGRIDGPETEVLLEQYIAPLMAKGVDTIVLGCTHYPFLRPLVEKIAGEGVAVIDTGKAVARQVVRVLERYGMLNDKDGAGSELFFSSADPREVEPVIRLLWGSPVLVVEQVKV